MSQKVMSQKKMMLHQIRKNKSPNNTEKYLRYVYKE